VIKNKLLLFGVDIFDLVEPTLPRISSLLEAADTLCKMKDLQFWFCVKKHLLIVIGYESTTIPHMDCSVPKEVASTLAGQFSGLLVGLPSLFSGEESERYEYV